MKGIFKTLSMVVLLAALVGGAILVQRNAETKKGAAANETSTSVLPSKVNTVAGQNFDVHVWMNTGKDTDKLVGSEFTVTYDSAKAEFVKAEAQNGYTVLNDDLSGTVAGTKVFKMVTMGEEKTGAVDLVKLTFKALTAENGNIGLWVGAKQMIAGQSTTWDVATYFGNSYGLTGGVAEVSQTPKKLAQLGEMCGSSSGEQRLCETGLICTYTPPVGFGPMDAILRCAKPVVGAKLGEMCGGIAGRLCQSGLKCNYSNSGQTDRVGADLSGVCVKTGYAQLGEICTGKMAATCGPGLVCSAETYTTTGDGRARELGVTPGVCTVPSEKIKCGWCGRSCTNIGTNTDRMCPAIAPPSGVGCVNQNNTCVTVSIQTGGLGQPCVKGGTQCADGLICKYRAIKTAAEASQYANTDYYKVAGGVCSKPDTQTVTLSGRFGVPSVVVGSEISAMLSVYSGTNKVSAVNVKALFDPNFFEILSVTPVTGSQGVAASGDSATGVVSVYMFWQSAAANLPSSPEFVTVKLKAKKAGLTTFKYDDTYKHEVSGVDAAGNSLGFTVATSGTPARTIVTEPVAACMPCTTGLARSTGNANCDTSVNTIDFEIWRSEVFDKGGVNGTLSNSWKADFNCDQKVSGIDMEIWRSTVFK